MNYVPKMNRRSFVAGAAAVGGGFALGFQLPFGADVALAADGTPEINAWVVIKPDDTVVVRLDRPFDASRVAERHFVATASCGICGKASIDEVALRAAPIPPGPLVSRAVVLALPGLLRAAQRAFDETGGLHAAAFQPLQVSRVPEHPAIG